MSCQSVASYLSGYILSLLFSSLLISRIVVRMGDMIPRCAKASCPREAFEWKAKPLGWVETVLYMTSFLTGQATFVPIWLTFKTIGRWQTLKGGDGSWRKVYSREKAFEVYAVGNGLSILNAVVGWQLVRFVKEADYVGGFALIAAALLLGSALLCWLKRQKHLPCSGTKLVACRVCTDRLAQDKKLLECQEECPGRATTA